jgi:hypothetical protein
MAWKPLAPPRVQTLLRFGQSLSPLGSPVSGVPVRDCMVDFPCGIRGGPSEHRPLELSLAPQHAEGGGTMNIQIFVEPVARHRELAAAKNAWLADHPRVEIEDETVQIFHNHSTNADDVLIMLLYKEKAIRKAEKKD